MTLERRLGQSGLDRELYCAVRSRDAAGVKRWLKEGGNARQKVHDGNLLHLAAIEGAPALVVRLLVKRGADIHGKGIHDFTPLHWAAKCGNAGLVKELLRAGADPNARDDYGNTPLFWPGLEIGLADGTPALEALLDGGADIHAKNKRGWTALHDVLSYGSVRGVRCLLERGADVHARTDKSGRTALHDAAYSSKADEKTELVLRHGGTVDVNDHERHGYTPLHSAARSNHRLSEVLGAAKLLLDVGADPNAVDNNGNAALHHAFGPDHAPNPDLANLLLAHGAKPDARNRNGETPVARAAGWGVSFVEGKGFVRKK